eukprot:UN02387
MTEVMAALGKMWSETSDKVRTPFATQAAKSKAKYDKEMEKYRQTPEHTEFQKRRNLHMLIQKYVNQIEGAKRKAFIKYFLQIQINQNNLCPLISCLRTTIVML